jgi:hypothetical protein
MISSLEALRKITNPSKASAPIEGFQKYLENKTAYDSVPLSTIHFRKGVSIAKIKSIVNKFYKKTLNKAFCVWKIEAIKEKLNSDRSFIENHIKIILSNGLRSLSNFYRRKASRYYFYWKNTTKKTPIPLISVLNKVFTNKINHVFIKILLIHQEKTKLVYFVINSLLEVIRKKLIRWKLNANKLSIELSIANKVAVVNFREFQKIKTIELLMNYRKARGVFKMKYFSRWKDHKPLPKPLKPDEKPQLKAQKHIQKLNRQKEKHENAVLESKIKEKLLEMLIKVVNTEI